MPQYRLQEHLRKRNSSGKFIRSLTESVDLVLYALKSCFQVMLSIEIGHLIRSMLLHTSVLSWDMLAYH